MIRQARADNHTVDRSVRLRARCEAALRDLHWPSPFSVRGFCLAVEDAVGSPITLHAMPVGWASAGICGLLVETDTCHHIFFTRQQSVLAQATTIVHECGHILIPDNSPADPVLPAGLPGIDPQSVRAVRGRSGFDADIEATVELFASIVLAGGTTAGARETTASLRLSERFG